MCNFCYDSILFFGAAMTDTSLETGDKVGFTGNLIQTIVLTNVLFGHIAAPIVAMCGT
tara:strand:+ start:307 stop:480 length:174 start_codon:yes stop_codon:yes gene_type:complete